MARRVPCEGKRPAREAASGDAEAAHPPPPDPPTAKDALVGVSSRIFSGRGGLGNCDVLRRGALSPYIPLYLLKMRSAVDKNRSV